jgi:predicted HNH restriction endonuclease
VVRKNETVLGEDVEPIDLHLAATDGSPRLVAHLRRERNPALAAPKRRAMIEQLGRLHCERCGVVPSQTLGPHADAFIEVHHDCTQVAAMVEGHITRLAELAFLCTNCHRIVHQEKAGSKATA